MNNFWKASLIAIIGSTVVNLVLLFILRPLVVDPATPLAALAVLPVTFLTVVGAIGAITVYAIVRHYAANPSKAYLWIAIIACGLSLIPDYLILNATSGHFAGANLPSVLTLMFMHVVAAIIDIWALLTFWKKETA